MRAVATRSPDLQVGEVHLSDAEASARGMPLDGERLAGPERRWRKTFDRYGEFEMLLREMAHAKFSG